jgi:hypothetical protein
MYVLFGADSKPGRTEIACVLIISHCEGSLYSMFALLPASSHGLAYSLIDPQNSPAAPYHPLTATPSIHGVLCHPLSFLRLDRFQSGIHLLTKTPATATALCHPLSTSPTNHILNRKLHQFLIFYQL